MNVKWFTKIIMMMIIIIYITGKFTVTVWAIIAGQMNTKDEHAGYTDKIGSEGFHT